jgi:hypothetical protein
MVEGTKANIDSFTEFVARVGAAEENLFHGFTIKEAWEGVNISRCIGPFTIYRDAPDRAPGGSYL